VSDCCLTTNEEFFSYNVARTSYIWWNDNDVCFVLDQPTLLDFDSAGWLKQQPTGRLVATLDSAGWLKQQPTGRFVATLDSAGWLKQQPTGRHVATLDSAGWLKQQPTGRHVATLDSAGWLKQQPTGRHVATLVHIILILSQYVFPLAHESCVLSEAANFSFIGFGSTQLHIDIHDLLHLSQAR
jgi:ribosomal protein S19E (S16A)